MGARQERNTPQPSLLQWVESAYVLFNNKTVNNDGQPYTLAHAALDTLQEARISGLKSDDLLAIALAQTLLDPDSLFEIYRITNRSEDKDLARACFIIQQELSFRYPEVVAELVVRVKSLQPVV